VAGANAIDSGGTFMLKQIFNRDMDLDELLDTVAAAAIGGVIAFAIFNFIERWI